MCDFEYSSPFITTKLTRRLAMQMSLQDHLLCADFEQRAVECYENYGYKNVKCKDYISDLRECITGYKREMRIIAMKKERHKQYEEGSRKNLYAPPPPDDAY